jgi:hypothetical protein
LAIHIQKSSCEQWVQKLVFHGKTTIQIAVAVCIFAALCIHKLNLLLAQKIQKEERAFEKYKITVYLLEASQVFLSLIIIILYMLL